MSIITRGLPISFPLGSPAHLGMVGFMTTLPLTSSQHPHQYNLRLESHPGPGLPLIPPPLLPRAAAPAAAAAIATQAPPAAAAGASDPRAPHEGTVGHGGRAGPARRSSVPWEGGRPGRPSSGRCRISGSTPGRPGRTEAPAPAGRTGRECHQEVDHRVAPSRSQSSSAGGRSGFNRLQAPR